MYVRVISLLWGLHSSLMQNLIFSKKIIVLLVILIKFSAKRKSTLPKWVCKCSCWVSGFRRVELYSCFMTTLYSLYYSTIVRAHINVYVLNKRVKFLALIRTDRCFTIKFLCIVEIDSKFKLWRKKSGW